MSVNVGATLLAEACADIERKATDDAAPQDIVEGIKSAAAIYRKTLKALPAVIADYEREAA